MTNSNDNNMTVLFFIGLGMALIIAAVGVMLWVQNLLPGGGSGGLSFNSGRRIRLTPTPAVVETTSATGTNLDAVIAIINKSGCPACHTIPNIPGAVGQIGPNLSNIGVDGATRRPGYTAEEYIRESIQNPSAFTAPNCPTGPCPAGVMPQITLSNDELETLVKYLSNLGVSN